MHQKAQQEGSDGSGSGPEVAEAPTEEMAAAAAARLQYVAPVVLPRGMPASPFSSSTAEATARIGSGASQSKESPKRLSPNLKQADGPIGEVSVPTVLEAATGAKATLVQRGRTASLRVG